MKSLRILIRWFLCMMAVFIMQKLFFVCTTWREGTHLSDVPDVVWHGLKLDLAVSAYVLIIPWLVLMLLPRFGCRQRVLRTYYYIIGALMAVIFVADASLYPFWQFKLDASVFLYTDKPGDALASVSGLYVAMRLVLWAVWMAVLWCVERGARLFAEADCAADKPRVSIRAISARVAIALASALVMVLLIRGGVGKGTNNVSAAYYSDSQYLNHCSVNPVFNLIYSFGKQEDFGNEYQYYSEEEREHYMQGIYHINSTSSTHLLRTQKPDILLIIWEGMCNYINDSLKVTPNLAGLSTEGVSFSQCYSNSFRTDRGQVALLSGWLSIPKTSLMKIPLVCDRLPSLTRSLRGNGYSSAFWYGGDISFANTGGYMRQMGFQKIVSDADFSRDEIKTEWGVYDGTLLDKLYCTIANMEVPSPFFHTVMTLSSHEPWIVPHQKYDNERFNAFNYTDRCIGQLIAKLKRTSLWDNLLIIITADHGVPMKDGVGLSDKTVTRIPMIWCGGAVNGSRTVTQIMNQSDLAATLLGQLGISHEEFVYSRDVMSKDYVYPSAFFTYNGGMAFCDSTGYTVYDFDGDIVLEGNDEERVRKAKATLQTLYKSIAEY